MRYTREMMTAGLLACLLSAATAVADDFAGPAFGPPMGYGWDGYEMGPGRPYGEEFGNMPYSMFGYQMYDRRGYYSYLADRLDLSADQRKSIRDIFERSREDARKLRDAMLDNRVQLRDTLEAKGYGSQFEQLAKKQGELFGQMITLRGKARAQILNVLTEEQRKELKDLRMDRHDRDYDDWY